MKIEESQAANPKQLPSIIINDAMIPIKNNEVTIREEIEEDGKYILFNAENELILVTNRTGKFILDKCNGNLPIGQIIKEIKNNFVLEDDTALSSIIAQYMEKLIQAKIITIKDLEIEY